MSIQFSLRENLLTPESDDYVAIVHPRGTVTYDQLLDFMMQRGTSLTRVDLQGVLTLQQQVITDLLLQGLSVSSPLAHFSSSIKGLFQGTGDNFDTTRHTVLARVRPGAELRQAYATGVATEKVRNTKPTPALDDYYDYGSSTTNSLLTPGNGGRIEGDKLRFDPADPAQGIFLIAADGSETKVSTLMSQRAGELLFVWPPNITAGTYTLQVRALFGQASIRTGELEARLTVV